VDVVRFQSTELTAGEDLFEVEYFEEVERQIPDIGLVVAHGG
jgi:hypothetical protein